MNRTESISAQNPLLSHTHQPFARFAACNTAPALQLCFASLKRRKRRSWRRQRPMESRPAQERRRRRHRRPRHQQRTRALWRATPPGSLPRAQIAMLFRQPHPHPPRRSRQEKKHGLHHQDQHRRHRQRPAARWAMTTLAPTTTPCMAQSSFAAHSRHNRNRPSVNSHLSSHHIRRRSRTRPPTSPHSIVARMHAPPLSSPRKLVPRAPPLHLLPALMQVQLPVLRPPDTSPLKTQAAQPLLTVTPALLQAAAAAAAAAGAALPAERRSGAGVSPCGRRVDSTANWVAVVIP